MRESNHAINFLLYMATSKRFRLDFIRIVRRHLYRLCGPTILFCSKHVCTCFTEPGCLIRLEQHVSDVIESESVIEPNRKNQAAYKTAHYYSNIERRRQNQLLKATLLNNNTTVTGASLSPAVSYNELPPIAPKSVRTLTWNPYDPPVPRQVESKRQAARLSRHCSTTGTV